MGVPEVPASLRSWMSAVSEIVRSVNAAEPLASVLTRVADQACELIGFEFCAVMLADERRECLQIAGWSGLTPDYLAQVSDGQGLRIRPPGPDLDTPAARAYREGRTIVVPDVREARSYGRLRWPWRRPGCGPSSRTSSGSCRWPTRRCAAAGPCWSGPSSSTTS